MERGALTRCWPHGERVTPERLGGEMRVAPVLIAHDGQQIAEKEEAGPKRSPSLEMVLLGVPIMAAPQQ